MTAPGEVLLATADGISTATLHDPADAAVEVLVALDREGRS